MIWVKTAAKTVLLAVLSFGVAAAVGATGLQESYVFALVVSVMLCPAFLGFVGGTFLSLGAAATLLGINFLPVLNAIDQTFHLGEPADFRWLLASFVFAWGGWRLGKKLR